MKIFRMHALARHVFDVTGATLADGRWHHRGTPVVYAAQGVSLSLLETIIHAGGRRLPPRALSTISIPDRLHIEQAAWRDLPDSRTFGDRWVREGRSAILAVPSIAVNKLESNFVLNPAHPHFAGITHERIDPFPIDPRFIFFS